MKCILLCAGYATRLYPLTENQPKSLLSVGDKTIIDHIMEKVERVADVDEVLLVTNDRFVKHFDSWLKTYSAKKKVEVVSDSTKSNEDRLGAVGDIMFIIGQKQINDDLMVIAGDNLFEFSLRDFNEFYKAKKSTCVALFDIKDKKKAARTYGVVSVDNNGKIMEFEEKPENPKTSLVSTACYIFSKDAVSKIKEYMKSHKKDDTGDFLKWLTQSESVYGYIFTERWFDIGSFEALEEAYKAYGGK